MTKNGTKKRKNLSWILFWARDILIALFLFFILIAFVAQPFKVEGDSMHPNLENKERILVEKLSLRLGKIKRGDIVVFGYPKNPGKTFVKRVIGLPGEEIEIKNGVIHINGEPLAEPYLDENSKGDDDLLPLRLKGNEYYLLGDNRVISDDSRAFGPIAWEAISGRAIFIYWPPRLIGRTH
jgi:signal peptidase I